MAMHKFTVGDRVSLMADRLNANVRPGIYNIVQVMPEAGQGCQYRAKHALDNHERVLDEAQLRSAKGI